MRPQWIPAAAMTVLLAAGCSVNSTVLPGSQGGGEGAYSVTLEMASMSGAESNTAVMVEHVNVGTVTDIRVQDWHAVATLRLNRGVALPANTTAKVGQTSLLGAKHIELMRPARPVGKLGHGDTIPLARTGAFPDTEDVLASAALLFNGGGLQNIRTIVAELNNALEGREGQIRRTLREVNAFMAGLDEQKSDIVRALHGLDRLGEQAARHNTVIEKTLHGVPPALAALNSERGRFVHAMTSLRKLADSATGVLDEGRAPLVSNLQQIHRVMKGLADSGDDLVKATTILASGPFPLSMERPANAATGADKGDFVNIYATLDFTKEAIDNYHLEMLKRLPGNPLPKQLPGPVNPLLSPLSPALGPPRSGTPAEADTPLNSLLGIGGGR